MKEKKIISFRVFSFILLFFSCFFSQLYPTIKGSETVLSVEPFFTFPSEGSDNTMLGFGWFKNGFGLEDSTTTCTFNSVFPVSGDLYLNGGSLYLSSDLHLQNMATWYTSGDLYANEHLIDFCASVTGIGEGVYGQVFDSANIAINSDMRISGSVRFNGECLFNGNGKRVLLEEDGYLLIEDGAQVTFKDVWVDGIVEGKVCCLGFDSKIVLDDVRWIQDGDYSFTQGSLRIFNNVDFVGSHTFFYQSKQTSTIDTHSFWNLFQGITLSIGRHDGAYDIEPLYFADSTAVLNLENSCLSITSSGMSLLHGTMIVDRGVEIEIDSTDSTHGLILGDGTDEGNMEFRFHPGARILFSKGHLVFENTDPRSLRSRSGEATFVRAAESVFYLNRDVQLEGIALDTHPNSQLFIEDGKDLDYVGCRVIYPGVEFELGGSRYNNYTNVMKGNDAIFLLRGDLSPYTYVQNSNNTLHGNGDISGKIILQDENAEVNIDVNGMLANDVELNGGKVTFDHDTMFSQDAFFVGPGTVDVSRYTLQLGSDDLVADQSLCWDGDDGTVFLNSRVTLSETWTVCGRCHVDGNAQTLVLEDGGEVVLDEGASLSIRNLRIEGVKDSNIRCLDDDGVIVLDRVMWIQDGNFSFTQGAFEFYNDVDFIGSHTFAYESNATSTIHSNSEWHIMDDLRIELGRCNGVEPLAFTDNTSVFHLDNCTLSAGPEGVSFTKGRLWCHHKVLIDILSTDSTNGISLGNGNEEDDLQLVIEAGANVLFLRGHLAYNITAQDGLSAHGSGSRLVRYGDTFFFINEDITLANIAIVDKNFSAAMIVKDGKTVSYDKAIFEWPGVGIEISGYRYNFYTNLLAGNDELFLLKGTLAAYTAIQGSGNLIHGGGSLSGPITLLDSNAEVQFKLNGPLTQSVYLNGGTATLLQSLVFSSDSRFITSGTVLLDNNDVVFGSVNQDWEGDIYWDSSDSHIDFNSNVDLYGTWTFDGDCLFHGNGNTLTLTAGGQIVVADDSRLILRDVTIKGVKEENIICLGDKASIVLQDVEWVQDGHFSFSTGSMLFKGESTFSGAYTFSYESFQTSTIDKDSRWRIEDSMRLSIGRREADGSVQPIYFEDSSAFLKLSNCTLAVTDSGMRLTRGGVDLSHDVVIDVASTYSQYGLELGDDTANGDIEMYFYPGSALHLERGAIAVNSESGELFNLRQGNATLFRGKDSIIYINKSIGISRLLIDLELGAQMVVEPGADVVYDKCLVENPYCDFYFTGKRGNDVCNFLLGNDEIYMNKGALPLATYIWGEGNSIRGNGNVSGPIVLQNSDAKLSIGLNGSVLEDLSLGGGVLSLADDLYLGKEKVLSGDGVVNLSAYGFYLGTNDQYWSGNIYWDSLDGNITMRSNFALAGTWTFSGNCVINGGGNVLQFLDNSEIVIEKGSSLVLKNTKLKNLSGHQIRCLDDEGMVQFYDSKTMLDGTFSFTRGMLYVMEEFEVHGTYTLDYQSEKPLFIGPCTILRMMEGSTLSYNPRTAERNLFEFYGCMSQIELRGATLHSTTTGLCLRCGILTIGGDSSIASDATVPFEGIWLGGGEASEDNLMVNVLPNAKLEVSRGYVVEKNVG